MAGYTRSPFRLKSTADHRHSAFRHGWKMLNVCCMAKETLQRRRKSKRIKPPGQISATGSAHKWPCSIQAWSSPKKSFSPTCRIAKASHSLNAWNSEAFYLVMAKPPKTCSLFRSYTHLVITAHQHEALKTSIRSHSDFGKCIPSSATFDSPNVCKNDSSPKSPAISSASLQVLTAAGALTLEFPSTLGQP